MTMNTTEVVASLDCPDRPPAVWRKPKSVEAFLAAGFLGGRSQATPAGRDTTLTLLEKDGRLHFTVRPAPVAAPVATVVLPGAK